MKVNCVYAEEIGLESIVKCNKGLQGGRPNLGYCSNCSVRRPFGRFKLGNKVEKVISMVTRRKIKPCIGCKKRKMELNRI